MMPQHVLDDFLLVMRVDAMVSRAEAGGDPGPDADRPPQMPSYAELSDRELAS